MIVSHLSDGNKKYNKSKPDNAFGSGLLLDRLFLFYLGYYTIFPGRTNGFSPYQEYLL